MLPELEKAGFEFVTVKAMGETAGAGPVGAAVGPVVGAVVGVPEGAVVGVPDGAVVGEPDGLVVGVPEGAVVGVPDGAVVGDPEGFVVGVPDGAVVGVPDGLVVGVPDGAVVGGGPGGIAMFVFPPPHAVIRSALKAAPVKIALRAIRRITTELDRMCDMSPPDARLERVLSDSR